MAVIITSEKTKKAREKKYENCKVSVKPKVRKATTPTIWTDRIAELQERVTAGETLEDIGAYWGVTRQRIYQVMCKYGLQTPVRERKNFLRGKEPKYYWLNKMLTHKKLPKQDRLRLLETIPIPDYCPVLGTKLNYDGTGKVGWAASDTSPSVDQFIPNGGYTEDNISIISLRANRLKHNGTAEEHEKIAKWMKLRSNHNENKVE